MFFCPPLSHMSNETTGLGSVGFFPGNSQWIVTSSSDRTVRVWDTESGVCYLTLQGHTGIVRGADVTQTENLLVTGSWDSRVTIWKYKIL